MKRDSIVLARQKSVKEKERVVEYLEGMVSLKIKGTGSKEAKDKYCLYFLNQKNIFVFFKPNARSGLQKLLVRLIDIKSYDLNDETEVFTIVLNNNETYSFVFKDVAIAQKFDELISTKLGIIHSMFFQSDEYDVTYCRYFVAAHFEVTSVKDVVTSQDKYRFTNGNLKRFIDSPALKPFKFVTENFSSESLFYRRIWLGVIKYAERTIGKGFKLDLDDEFAKTQKEAVCLFVTTKQLIEFEQEPFENYPAIFPNVVDSLALPDWMEVNTVYIMLPENLQDGPQKGPFPYHYILPLQSDYKRDNRNSAA